MNDNEQKYSSTPYRASGNLNTVIGNPNIIEFMTQNADSKKRNTGLEYKLRNL